MAVTRPRPGLYNWRRFSKPTSRAKRKFDPENVDHWIKQVEKASEFAVSEVFSSKKKPYSQGLYSSLLDLETAEQLQDHDEAYIEAQELLSDWMNSKVKLELASDQEEDNENHNAVSVTSSAAPTVFQKYEKFDDFCSQLEKEMEDTSVQEFLQHLLQSEVVENGVLEDLRIEDFKEKRKPRDPRITMELRHKLVKENRLKRQKQQELLKQEKALKKSAMAEAQKQLQEENKKKVLKARREEEKIQKEMVKLRKKLVERRHLLEEAKKMERKSHDLKEREKLTEVSLTPTMSTHQNCKEERGQKEKQIKIQELLDKADIANQKCLQKYFSAWYKLILDLRVKMGKARALGDWKCQMKFLRAWRDYTWSQKLEQETLKMETQLRDQNRKKHLASEFNRKCILRSYFVEWQCWSRTEVEKRELHLKKEETRKKMAKLLEEVVLGKYVKDCSGDAKRIHETEDLQEQSINDKAVARITSLQDGSTSAKRERANSCSSEASQKHSLHVPRKPKWAWQVTLKHAALNAGDRALFCNRARNPTQPLGMHNQKMDLPFEGPLEHYHVLQQQLIEEQRRQLQEQQELILQLKEEERLKTVREQAKQTTVATTKLTSQTPETKEEEQLRENQLGNKNTEPLRLENYHPVVQRKKNLKVLPPPHPLLKAMEERALQRAERRRELEEAKRKREEEKLAQIQAEQEERQRQETAEKEAQLQKKREEKRLQKMQELEKQKKLERQQQLFSMATEHYKISLLRKQGLEPWKRLIQQTRKNVLLAERHCCFRLQKKCLLAWHHHTQEMLTIKTVQAEELYSCLLLRKSFRIWREYKNYISTLEENAKNIHDTSLKKKVFWAWFDVISEEKSVFWEKQKLADQHSDRRMIRTVFRAWQQIPALMKEERKKEERIEHLRKRVAEILPDFKV